jgi:E3 SUMO-protein ligase PIAS1
MLSPLFGLDVFWKHNMAIDGAIGFQYKYSPFYEMRVRIGEVKTLEGLFSRNLSAIGEGCMVDTKIVMASHRNTINVVIKVQEHPVLQQCTTDPSLRVMVFCAAGNSGAQDICFPYQSELKVNGGEVKANLRGLKNKPGSTKPVDITDLLRLKQVLYPNTVEYTYALTTKARARSHMYDFSARNGQQHVGGFWRLGLEVALESSVLTLSPG